MVYTFSMTSSKLLILSASVILLSACNASPTTNNTPPVSLPTVSDTTVSGPTNNIYQTKTDTTKGPYLADFNGNTLYVFDKDTANTSNCYGTCAKNWPIYTSGAIAETQLPPNITVVTRTDGSKQFAWMGKPLYYFAGDQKAGDVNGDGVGGTWHIVKP